jgi:hypothetical protein
MADNTELHNNSSSSTQQHEIKDNKANQKVPFYMLFNFADKIDVTLMIIGTISAMANGLAQPLMTLIFGKIINAFGSSDPSDVVKQVSKVYNYYFASFYNLFFLFQFIFLVQMFIHKKVKPNSWNSWLSIMRLTSE